MPHEHLDLSSVLMLPAPQFCIVGHCIQLMTAQRGKTKWWDSSEREGDAMGMKQIKIKLQLAQRAAIKMKLTFHTFFYV